MLIVSLKSLFGIADTKASDCEYLSAVQTVREAARLIKSIEETLRIHEKWGRRREVARMVAEDKPPTHFSADLLHSNRFAALSEQSEICSFIKVMVRIRNFYCD